MALYHDAAEIYTGDLPTPVKYYSEEMRKNYKQIEAAAEKILVSHHPEYVQVSLEGGKKTNDYIRGKGTYKSGGQDLRAHQVY